MLHPSYSDLMNVVNSNVEEGEEPVVNSRYSIVMATAKRARQIVAGDMPLVEEKDGNMLITADHGNAEQMVDYKTGEPHTAHTTNPVPLILVTSNKNLKLKSGGKLADLAPTMLDLMNLEKPEEMTGISLLDKE